MKAYHFAKDIKNGFIEFFNEISDCKGIVCFDFEDSIAVNISTNFIFERNAHRIRILRSIDELSPFVTFGDFGFRINSVNSEVYHCDIQSLNTLGSVKSVFIPKVESSSDLIRVINDLVVEVHEIIPIIETQKGFDNLTEILSVKDDLFKHIAFGHCDYNLSMGNFPFYHQDSLIYWAWISYLNEECEKAGVGLINSPVLDLDNEGLFQDTLMKCKDYYKVDGQITMCKSQTRSCNSAIDIRQRSFTRNSRLNDLKTMDLIIKQYEQNLLIGKTFAVNPERLIISPQEYMAAINKRGL